MKKLFTPLGLCAAIAIMLNLTSCHKYPITATTTNNISTTVNETPAILTKIASLPANEQFKVLETSGNTIYAASASGIVYKSTDNGFNWAASAIVKQGTLISALAIFNNDIYVGTYSDGIFVSKDGGSTWANQSTIDIVTSFTIWNNNLYASSSDDVSASSGVIVLNPANGTWSNFNSTGLPSNYDFNVDKTIVVNQTIASIRGGNGNFYTYDTNAGKWTWKSYFDSYHPIPMQDVIYDQGTLIVSSGANLYNSNNVGATWVLDTLGLQPEPRTITFTPKVRVLYAADNTSYAISNLPAGGALIQQRDSALPAGSNWATHNQGLSIPGFVNAVCALNNVLFLATDNGLYYEKI